MGIKSNTNKAEGKGSSKTTETDAATKNELERQAAVEEFDKLKLSFSLKAKHVTSVKRLIDKGPDQIDRLKERIANKGRGSVEKMKEKIAAYKEKIAELDVVLRKNEVQAKAIAAEIEGLKGQLPTSSGTPGAGRVVDSMVIRKAALRRALKTREFDFTDPAKGTKGVFVVALGDDSYTLSGKGGSKLLHAAYEHGAIKLIDKAISATA